jgi:hypothetical protein
MRSASDSLTYNSRLDWMAAPQPQSNQDAAVDPKSPGHVSRRGEPGKYSRGAEALGGRAAYAAGGADDRITVLFLQVTVVLTFTAPRCSRIDTTA